MAAKYGVAKYMIWFGPVELEVRRYSDSDRRVFFDPIGSIDLCGCTRKSDDELDAMEERDEEGWWLPESSLTADSKPPRYGGNFEVNLWGYRVGLTVWWKPLYRVATKLNEWLVAWEDRKVKQTRGAQ